MRCHLSLALPLALAALVAGVSGVPGSQLPAESLGDGLVAWESNRTGEFRIFVRDLRSTAERRISPEEPGRDHCCAAVSPDGKAVAYLSLPAGKAGYFEGRTAGQLRLVSRAGGRVKVLAEEARTYSQHRAVVWWNAREVAFIDGEGVTQLLNVESGRRARLTAAASKEFGWLIDATGRWATTGNPTFSPFDRASGVIVPAPTRGGCQAVLSGDGRFGVWAAGAGGPIARLDLATRQAATLLRKNDPRVPDRYGYLYFPKPSHDSRALAFAASRGEHDHFSADYEVFVVATDPASLEPLGEAVRISRSPGVDRFPDVWLAPDGVVRPRLAPPVPRRASAEAAGWPASREALAFLWPDGERFGAVVDGGHLVERGDLLAVERAAWLDGRGRMVLAGGRFTLAPDYAGQVDDALQGTNEMTLELEVEPWSNEDGTGGPIVALANAPGSRSFALRQEGDRLLLVLRTSDTDRSGGEPVEVGRVRRGRATHVALSFTPGRLSAAVDGRPTAVDRLVPGDFFHWNAVHLTFGGEERGGERWRGWLAGVRLTARAESVEELGVAHAAWSRDRALRSLPPRLRVEARLLGSSRAPRLESIAPYREALLVQEFEVTRVLEGESPSARLRVARWAFLGGEPMPALRAAAGDRFALLLEPFAGNARAESLYLSDTLAEDFEAPLWLDVSLEPIALGAGH